MKVEMTQIYVKPREMKYTEHKETCGFPLYFSTSRSVRTVLVFDLFKKKWGSYQGEKPIVHSKNTISEPSWREVVVHSPPFLSVVVQL